LQRQLVRIRDQDGVAADLDGELRRADYGRTNPLAWVPDRRQITPVGEPMAQLFRQVGAEIAEASRLALIEIFSDAS
jgi:hypothetical protein